MLEITASIVLYHNKKEQVRKVIKSFLSTELNVKLYLIDNSSHNNLSILADFDDRIEYIFNNKNLGYGAAHNIAIKKSLDLDVKYHVVLNPDLYFSEKIIKVLYDYMNLNNNIANIMPKILYPNGDNQFLAKLLPTPYDWLKRRFIPNKFIKKSIDKFELRYTNYNQIMNVPFLSGCFMFLRNECVKEIGLFDENIFMYMEDVDLNRRLHMKYKTIYYPFCDVYHEYERGSHKNWRLLWISIESSIKYFNKWGWFFDKKRTIINSKVLKDTNYE